jgi:hypothetical protein
MTTSQNYKKYVISMDSEPHMCPSSRKFKAGREVFPPKQKPDPFLWFTWHHAT